MALGDFTYRLKPESGDASPVDEVGGSITLSGGTISLQNDAGDYFWRFTGGQANAAGPSRTTSATTTGGGATMALKMRVATYPSGSTDRFISYSESTASISGLLLGNSSTSWRAGYAGEVYATGITTPSTAVITVVVRATMSAAGGSDKVDVWHDFGAGSGSTPDFSSSTVNLSNRTFDTLVVEAINSSVLEVFDWVIWGEELSDADCGTLRDDGIRVTLDGGGDATAPVLSSGSATETSDTTATLGATTDEGNGTLYWVVTTSATEPSAAQVKAGDDHADAAAAYADSDAVGSTGAKTNNATGLTASTAYYAYAMHEDAAANQSDVLYLGTFTTDAANAAPSWSGTPSAMSSKRGQAYTPQDITSLVSDADLDTLAYTITGAPTGVTIHSSTGIISGTPTAVPGVYACTVEADDGTASPVASSSFNITVVQAELALDSAGYEFGDGSDPATMAVVASTELQVAVYPLTEWPPASAIATATATTGTNGRLADLGDDDLSHGTTYRVIARNAADGETWAWTMTAS